MIYNGEIIDTSNTNQTDEKIKLKLRKILLKYKENLNTTSETNVCSENQEDSSETITEDMSSSIETIITECPNHRKGL